MENKLCICTTCGYILVTDDNQSPFWECPICSNRQFQTQENPPDSHVRRLCEKLKLLEKIRLAAENCYNNSPTEEIFLVNEEALNKILKEYNSKYPK